MRLSFLAILTWAVQLKALPSDVSLDHAAAEPETLDLPSEVAEVAANPSWPFSTWQPFLATNGSQTSCTETEAIRLYDKNVPSVQDCKTLRDQIAANPGVWFIHGGGRWKLWVSQIAEYETCSIFVRPRQAGLFFGAGDALNALDRAIFNKGHGSVTQPKCSSTAKIKVGVYRSIWPAGG